MSRAHLSERVVRPPGSSGRSLLALLLSGLLIAMAACHGDVSSKLEKVRKLQESGDQKAAVTQLHQILDAHPDQPEANYRLGVALVALGRASESIFPLKNAADSKAYARPAGLLLTAMLIRTQNYDDAITAADRVLKDDPKNETALVARAQAAIKSHQGKVALDSADRVLALHPKSPPAEALRAEALAQIPERRGEAEQLYQTLEGADWGKNKDGPGNMCVALGDLYKDEGKEQQAVEQLQKCADQFSGRASIVLAAVTDLDEMKHSDDATAVLRKAYEAHKDVNALRSAFSERLLSDDKLDEAESIVLQAAQQQNTAAAWQEVAKVRRLAGDPDGAMDAVKKGLAVAPKNDALEFFRADLLVEKGKLDEAESIAKGLQSDVYRKIILGRVELGRGHPKAALALFDDAERIWPDNAGLRVQTARAALELNDEKRAISELREATRTDAKHTDAALALAQLYFARGEYEFAYSMAMRQIDERGTINPEAHILAARASLVVGQKKQAYAVMADLMKRRDGKFAGAALAELARMDERLLGPAKARKNLEERLAKLKLDLAAPGNEVLLRQLVHLDGATGHAKQAVARVDSLLAHHQDSARLLALRGQLRLEQGETADAKSDFAKALSADPKQPFALAGEGVILRASGDLSGAIKHFDEAAQTDPNIPDFAYLAAQAALGQGDQASARKRLERLVQTHPGYAPACNDLAWLLAQDKGSMDRALMLAKRAVRVGGGAEMLDTLGYVQLQKGDVGASVETLQKAVRQDPKYATARYHLALALLRQGNRKKAEASLQAALAGRAFPEAEKARVELAKLRGGQAEGER